ncbi:hypothetical protein KIL84_008368 [Mauremys mutica]|uniref:Uncharacterized protein n=1 Tax=Mauremys mutica TaxID=74926 RepID=A0A9D3X4Z4_9SAUR|nr:hypothetical protein KIL84_008368 [Mauremys mutica]
MARGKPLVKAGRPDRQQTGTFSAPRAHLVLFPSWIQHVPLSLYYWALQQHMETPPGDRAGHLNSKQTQPRRRGGRAITPIAQTGSRESHQIFHKCSAPRSN